MRWRVFLLHRLVVLAPTILGVTTILFAGWSTLPTATKLEAAFGAAPGSAPWTYDPTLLPGQGSCPPPNATYGPASPCPNPVYDRDVATLGLDRPVPVQWGIYVYRTLSFQWGVVNNHSSLGNVHPGLRDRPAADVVLGMLPYSLELAALGLAATYGLAAPLVGSGLEPRRPRVALAAREVEFGRYLVPVFILGLLVLSGLVLAVGNLAGFIATPPWCPSGLATYSEFTGSWPPVTCFGSAYPNWMDGGTHTSPTGIPTFDALMAGAGWIALDSVLRMIAPAAVIGAGAGLALAGAARVRLSAAALTWRVRVARARGFSEAAVRARVVRPLVRAVVLGGIESTTGTFVAALLVAETVFHLNGVGSLLIASVLSGAGPMDVAVFFGGSFVLAVGALGASLVASALEARLDPEVLKPSRRATQPPAAVPVGQDETSGRRPTKVGPTS